MVQSDKADNIGPETASTPNPWLEVEFDPGDKYEYRVVDGKLEIRNPGGEPVSISADMIDWIAQDGLNALVNG